VQQEITVRRQKGGILRQDSRLSVKSLIESIENATKQVNYLKKLCFFFYIFFVQLEL